MPSVWFRQCHRMRKHRNQCCVPVDVEQFKPHWVTRFANRSGDPPLRNPTTGIAGCCARAASGPRRRPPCGIEMPNWCFEESLGMGAIHERDYDNRPGSSQAWFFRFTGLMHRVRRFCATPHRNSPVHPTAVPAAQEHASAAPERKPCVDTRPLRMIATAHASGATTRPR